MGLIKKFKKDLMNVEIFDTRAEMGAKAASDAEFIINSLLQEKESLNIVFAAAPSQNEVLEELCKKNIDWTRINAFHMDEYIGLPIGAPQCFGEFLKRHIFERKPFKNVYYISEYTDKYESLILKNHIDIVFMGIGENGHIAFNDPHVADFNDPKPIKEVELDEICRQQQVNDGCFESLDAVPKSAYTLTIPTLFGADHLICAVPASTKRDAVRRTVLGEISEECPATVLRKHKNATLYCDIDSGKDII